MRSPILDGLVPCGGCREYVDTCEHYRIGFRKSPGRKVDPNSPIEITRRAVIEEAGGVCQLCGRKSALLTARSVVRSFYAGKLRTDNAVAVCAVCRTDARGMDIAEWVATEQAPALAEMFLADRIKKGLPVWA